MSAASSWVFFLELVSGLSLAVLGLFFFVSKGPACPCDLLVDGSTFGPSCFSASVSTYVTFLTIPCYMCSGSEGVTCGFGLAFGPERGPEGLMG